MRLSSSCISAVIVVSMLGVQACDGSPETTPFQPAGPELSARSLACDFGRMSQDARSYFPGNGRESISATVQDLIDEMEDACAAGKPGEYTAKWFEVAGIIEQVLADGTGGDPVDGVNFLNQSVSVLGLDEMTPIFDPCGDDDPDCLPWEGADDGALPPFDKVLGSANGAWAVVDDDGPESVCSGFDAPCNDWNFTDHVWGVEPTTTSWYDALWGRTSLLFGYPFAGGSPRGEAGFTYAPGSKPQEASYEWLLIPYPRAFGSGEKSSELLVSLCADASASVGQQVLQKGRTILTESEQVSHWCPFDPLPVPTSGESFLQRLASFLSPLPAPLNAVAALGKGPGAGGLAGSFTDFYGVDIPTEAVIRIPAQPADGTLDNAIEAVGGEGESFRVVTETSSKQSPLENAQVKIEVIGNSGLIPAGGSVSGAGLDCPEGEFVCYGPTQADEDDAPGTLELPLVFTKTGQYSLCFTAELGRLQFERVCTEKFNIRP